MIIQTANIVSGFLLAAPQLKTFTKSEGVVQNINSAEKSLAEWSKFIGIAELILGTVILVQNVRYGVMLPSFYYFGFGGFAQGLIAIIMGLLLASHLFDNNQFFKTKIDRIRPYSNWIGIIGIVIGIMGII